MGVGKCQTAAATPAEPGDLPRWVSDGVESNLRNGDLPRCMIVESGKSK